MVKKEGNKIIMDLNNRFNPFPRDYKKNIEEYEKSHKQIDKYMRKLDEEFQKRKFDVKKQKLKVTNKGDYPVLLYFTNGLAVVPVPNTPVLSVPAKTVDIYDFLTMNYTDKTRFLYIQFTGPGVTEVDLEVV